MHARATLRSGTPDSATGGSVWPPMHRGEIASRALGCALALDRDGEIDRTSAGAH